VGVEVRGSTVDVAATVATLPWMAPERITLDLDRSLVLLSTSFDDRDQACAYAERRLAKSVKSMGVPVEILSSEAFASAIDVRA
jgi:hypothetical protein